MKKTYALITIMTAVCLLAIGTLDAAGRGGGGGGRGGGGGGGRGGGGGGRGGGMSHSVNRSPSMSRSAPQRSGGQQRQAYQQRPSNQQRQAYQQRPSGQQLQGYQQRSSGQQRQFNPSSSTAARSQLQQHFQNTPNQPIARQGSQRPQNFTPKNSNINPGQRLAGGGANQNLANRASNQRLGNLPDNFGNIGQDIRGKVDLNRPERGDWFNSGFFNNHNINPPYYNGGLANRWWAPATAVAAAGWLGWNSAPMYYGYYDDEWGYGSYDNGSYTQQPQSSQPQTYSQSSQQIQSAQTSGSNNSWMPLGVFAITKDSGSTITPNMYLQLALNKDGDLAGTYYNTTTNEAYETEGTVDKASQRAAWMIADNSSAPILETGLYNLTQDEVPVKVYFADDTTQDMMLVRLQSPEA